MSKKIVRGITDVKTITNQDFDTNNVNDLLSDGQYNYIHRKKGKTEEYHNLTDNIKTISSDNTELLSVTNYNKTTNTATLHPKHDAQKEQLLESTRNTITINHGENGTAEKTTVDTNPQKVLEHENLISDSEYITLDHQTGENATHIKTTPLEQALQEIISSIGGGATHTIQDFSTNEFNAVKHVVTIGQQTLTTFSFECLPGTAECVFTGELKEEFRYYVSSGTRISSGALSITNDEETITVKLINSAPSQNVRQHATFTFYDFIAAGGGGSID